MSVNVEKLENSMAKLTIEVPFDEFDKAVEKVYQKQKSRITLPGFRKGKAPRKMIEKMYGEGVFYEDAANDCINKAYFEETKELDLPITSQPEIEIVQVEKNKPFIFTATVATKPPVKLGKYKGVEIEKRDGKATKEAVAEAINKERESNARIIDVDDRAVKDGDIVNIDYEGSIDGVPFDGGAATGHQLTIGSHTFIDTFEDQLIGKKIGDDVEVNVTFPKEYHAEDLAGKPALFKVKINAIQVKELPELDDEFAQDVSEFDTFKEYEADVKKKLDEQAEKDARYIKEREAVAAAADNAEMDIPEPMIDTQVTYLIDNFSRRLMQQGLSIEQYMQFTGLTQEAMRDQMKPEAVKNIRSRLTLEAIVEAEKIEVSDEQFEEELEKMATNYGMKIEDLKAQVTPEEVKEIKMDLAVEKATAFLLENAKEVAPKKTTKKAADKEEKAEKKTTAKKTTAKKTTTKKAAEDKEEKAEKKTTAKKTTKKAAEDKEEKAEKKTTAKKTTTKKTTTKKAKEEE
ncbi:MAG: trigger factor [Lachnospiraceae bacterium]|nr:trigger factor [Lachnospiraceae bacterium]